MTCIISEENPPAQSFERISSRPPHKRSTWIICGPRLVHLRGAGRWKCSQLPWTCRAKASPSPLIWIYVFPRFANIR